MDARLNEKEQEKIDSNQDLTIRLRRLWKVKTTVMLIVVGALETVYTKVL